MASFLNLLSRCFAGKIRERDQTVIDQPPVRSPDAAPLRTCAMGLIITEWRDHSFEWLHSLGIGLPAGDAPFGDRRSRYQEQLSRGLAREHVAVRFGRLGER